MDDLSTVQQENGLIGLAQSEYATSEALSTVITSTAYLPRIQLYSSSSNAVKDGLIQQGHYGIPRSEKEVEDLGTEIDLWVLSKRFKAMEFGDDLNIEYNPNSDEFKRIAAKSKEKDSGAVFGIEYLVFLDEKQVFATYYMSNESARNESPNVTALTGKTATLSSKPAKNKKGQRWIVPVCSPCSTPLAQPDYARAKEEAEKFANPKAQVKATKEEAEATTRAR